MRIETPAEAKKLHQPKESGAGRVVFAFDRDYTVDVNPPKDDSREAVPLEWVSYLAHCTNHIVYATGNQILKKEATIPGTAEIVEAHPAGILSNGRGLSRPSRRDRVDMLGELYPEAEAHIVVDDVDLSDLDGWSHYPSWDFVPAAENGKIVPEIPPSPSKLGKVEDLCGISEHSMQI